MEKNGDEFAKAKHRPASLELAVKQPSDVAASDAGKSPGARDSSQALPMAPGARHMLPAKGHDGASPRREDSEDASDELLDQSLLPSSEQGRETADSLAAENGEARKGGQVRGVLINNGSRRRTPLPHTLPNTIART